MNWMNDVYALLADSTIAPETALSDEAKKQLSNLFSNNQTNIEIGNSTAVNANFVD